MRFALIVAGGSGSRMQSALPKQFLKLAGKPVLIHTLQKFLFLADKVVLVLPAQYESLWEELQNSYGLSTVAWVPGGATRFESVRNGLEAVAEQEGVVAVHDAVRPFVSRSVILQTFEHAEEKGSAVVAVPVRDSIRQVTGNRSRALDRSKFMLIQTPQTFRLSLLREAYKVCNFNGFTDDASVFEAAGNTVELLPGSYENIKITTPEDLFLGEAILKFQGGAI